MHTGHIENATRMLGSLAIRDETTLGGPGMISAWFPSLAELELLNQGAPIYVTIFGDAHPPLSVSVGSPPGYNG